MAEIIFIGHLYGQVTRWGAIDPEGISVCLTAAMGMGGGYIPMVIVNGTIFQTGTGNGNKETR